MSIKMSPRLQSQTYKRTGGKEGGTEAMTGVNSKWTTGRS